MKRLLEEGTSAELPVTPGTIADMKSLCLGLLEALHDKSLALIHQKKANRYYFTYLYIIYVHVISINNVMFQYFSIKSYRSGTKIRKWKKTFSFPFANTT